MTLEDGFDQPLRRSDHMAATTSDPDELKDAMLDAQMIAMAEREPAVGHYAVTVHFAMAYELACGKPIRLKRLSNSIKTPKHTTTNNLRHTTCKKCLHGLSNLAMARLDQLLKEQANARPALP